MFLLAYCLWRGMPTACVIFVVAVHGYLGMSLMPEKVAFSYRSKSGMQLAIFGLSMAWQPIHYLFYGVLAMFAYGMRFNCPCMIVYEKYRGCPCFAWAKKCACRRSASVERR